MRIDQYAAVTAPALTAILLLETLPDDPVNRAYNRLALSDLASLFGNGGPITITGTTAQLGPVPGAELLDGTGWTSTGWTGDFGAGFTHTSGNTSPLSRTITGLTVGQIVRLVFTKTATGNGTFAWTTNGVTQTSFLSGFAPTTLTKIMVAQATDITFSLTPNSSAVTFAFGSFSAKVLSPASPAITLKDSNGVEGTDIYATDSTRYNTAVGYGAGAYLDGVGIQNSLFGYQAGKLMTVNTRSIAIGYQSQYQTNGGNDNVSAGYQSLAVVSGYSNIAIGSSSLFALTSGYENTAVGHNSANLLTTGLGNTVVGSSAGTALTTGTNNTIIGQRAGTGVTTGSNNTYLGGINSPNITTGNNNTFIGYDAWIVPPTGGGTSYFTNISNKIFVDGTIGCVMIGTSYSYAGTGILQLPTNTTGARDGGIAFGTDLTLTQGVAFGLLRLIGHVSTDTTFQVYNELTGDATLGFRVTPTPKQYEVRLSASDQSLSIIDLTTALTRFKIQTSGQVQITTLGSGVVSSDATGLLSTWTVGTSLTTGSGILNTVQDIRTIATPQFAGVAIRSSGAAFNLTLATSEVLTAGRTLSLNVGDAARTLTLSGNPTIADWFNQSVKTTATPTFAGLTSTGTINSGVNASVAGFLKLWGTTTATEGNIYNDATYGLRLDTNSNARPIRIDGSYLYVSGNLGIGVVPSGTYKLEVNGGIYSGTSITAGPGTGTRGVLVNAGTGTNEGGYFAVQANAVTKVMLGTASGVLGGAHDDTGLLYSGAGAWKIYTAAALAMTIDTSGNVGIGMTPTAKLDLQGTNTQLVRFQNTSTYALMSLISSGTNQDAYFEFKPSGTGSGVIQVNGTNRLVIDTSGNVGIGAAPTAYKLDVTTGSNPYAFRTSTIGDFLWTALGGASGTTQMFSVRNNSTGAVCINTANSIPLVLGVSTGTGSGSVVNHLSISASGTLTLPGIIEAVGTSAAVNIRQPAGGCGMLLEAYTGTANTGMIIRFARGGALKWDFGTGVSVGGDYFELYDRTGGISVIQVAPTTAAIQLAGNLGVAVTPGAVRLYVKGAGTSTGYAFYVTDSANNPNFLVRDDGVAQFSKINSNTSAGAANVYVDSFGTIYKSTSSARYKTNIVDYSRGLADVLKLRPVSYNGISAVDAGKTFAGLIAEEVEAAGLTEYVTYDDKGRPDALQYSQMVALLISAVKEMSAEIKALKAA